MAKTLPNSMQHYALQYATQGVPIFALHRNSDGTSCTCLLEYSTTNPLSVAAMWRQYPDAAIGFNPDPTLGRACFQITEHTSETQAVLEAAEQMLPEPRAVISTPNGRMLYLYTWSAPDVTNHAVGNVKGDGVIFYGSDDVIVLPPLPSQLEHQPESSVWQPSNN